MIKIKFRFLFISILGLLSLYSCSNGEDEPDTSIIAENLIISLDENPSDNQVIAKIMASTNHGTLKFSFINQEPANALTINQFSGEISINDASLFDYEINPTIIAGVVVTNGPTTEVLEIKITLNDLEELPLGAELFDTEWQVAENDLYYGSFFDFKIKFFNDFTFVINRGQAISVPNYNSCSHTAGIWELKEDKSALIFKAGGYTSEVTIENAEIKDQKMTLSWTLSTAESELEGNTEADCGDNTQPYFTVEFVRI